jgi:hypothetical protein
VQRSPTNLVNSAYVVDNKENQFWLCTARYDFSSKENNTGECSRLANDIGRPSLTERYRGRAVVGSTMYGPLLPVIWFIEPTTGDVQFCSPRRRHLRQNVVAVIARILQRDARNLREKDKETSGAPPRSNPGPSPTCRDRRSGSGQRQTTPDLTAAPAARCRATDPAGPCPMVDLRDAFHAGPDCGR